MVPKLGLKHRNSHYYLDSLVHT